MKLKILSLIAILLLLFSGTALAQGFQRSAIHHYTHAGKYFSFSHVYDSVSDNTSKFIVIQTSDRMVHLSTAVAVGGQTKVQLQEAATVNSNGTSLNIWNHKRPSTETALSEAYHSPNIADGGDIFYKELLVGGTSVLNRVGGISRTREEFVLKKNTTYVVNATNTSGGTIDINIVGSFYEMNLQ